MRKWLAIGTAMAVIVVTGTAWALTAPDRSPEAVGDGKPTAAASTTTSSAAFTSEVDQGGDLPTKGDPEEAKEKDPEKPVDKDPGTGKPDDDSTPPGLVILHPVDGQVFKQKEVVFKGTTEPGARVFAGKWEADVDSEGNWKIVLFLSPGGNKATLKAIDAAGNTSTASVSVTFEAPAKEPDKPKDKDKGTTGWKFSATQVYGECSENPPFDVFHGTGKPGTKVYVMSEFGSATVKVDDKGKWEVKVFFKEAPVEKTFLVKVKDEFGNYSKFEFTRTD